MIELLPDDDDLLKENMTLQLRIDQLHADIKAIKDKLTRQAAFIDAVRQLMREHGLKLKRPASVLPKHNWHDEVAKYDDE